MGGNAVIEVVFTDAARELIGKVRELRGDDLSLVIGNGCCDSTAPFLFAGYFAGPTERQVAVKDGVRVFVEDGIAASLAGREVVVDAAAGVAPDSFSCEAELGYRFTLDRLPAIDKQSEFA
jgi:uncharacterized protein (DUF779 family)